MKTLTPLLFCVAVMAFGLGCKPKADGAATVVPAASGNHDAAGPISEAALGVKIYPGAKMVTSGETPDVVSANLETADSAEKVAKFYHQELGLPADATPSASMSGKKNGRMFAISIVPSGGVTAVSILGKK